MTTTLARPTPPAPTPAVTALSTASIDAACEQACSAIAPAWPLDRAIAVNPHWPRIGQPLRRVAARLGVLAGQQVFPPRERLREAWAGGRISPQDLDEALALLPAAQAQGLTARDCIAELGRPAALPRLPLLIDVLDDDAAGLARLPWRQAITHQVSQACAAYFDEHQADWQPARSGGLYAFWRETLSHDHGIGVLMGLPDLGQRLRGLPATRADAEHWVLARLGLPEAVWPDYLEAVLLTVQGWASWCAYLGWQARLAGRSDPHLRELLALRLAWGAVLLEQRDDAASRRAFAALREAWARAPARLQQAEDALLVDEVWQGAWDRGYQRGLARRLTGPMDVDAAPPAPLDADSTPRPPRPEVQAAFCIDVRSEPMRRALESVWPGLQTLGVAGFFGLPVAYTPLGTAARRPQLPGLLAPAMELTERILPAGAAALSAQPGTDTDIDADKQTAAAARARQQRAVAGQAWDEAWRSPQAAFAGVEAAGLGFLGPLTRWLRPSAAPRSRDDLAGLPTRWRALCRPGLHRLPLADRVATAARALHGLALTQGLAPLVLLVGHGSQTANNAHAAALDCGACCGQTGEANARALAQLLNDPAVRAGLRPLGITLPDDTVFAAALHNTTTDEIEGHDLDLLPPEARARWERLQPLLAHAGDQVRRERAARLGLDPRAGSAELLQRLRRRANDGAETRPEWGLAGNACFLIAPRRRSLGRVLEGRAFLHEYEAGQDADGSVLEGLMTAPMLVTHWINWQYHASTCEPERLGSGNKLLHNVVGQRIGVFEGHGGDLRIGLSRQALHDGRQWVHEPLRLTVVIDAPAERIDAVLRRHAVVRQLVEHGWLHLWRFEGDGLLRHAEGRWLATAEAGSAGRAVRPRAAGPGPAP